MYVAGRFDNYEIEGPFEGVLEPSSNRTFDDFVTKLGVVYYPNENLKLRGTWGQAFLAATLPELFGPRREFTFFRFIDPLNPTANGGPFASVFPLTVLGGNPDLQPQTSTTTTLGFEYESSEIEGLSLSASWVSTEFENLLGTLSGIFGWPPVYAFENWQQFPDQIRRDEEGVLTFVSMQWDNFSTKKSSAIDFDARYTFDTLDGQFATGVRGTYTLSLETIPGPGVPAVTQEGTNQGPVKLKGSAFLDWSNNSWSANLTMNFESDYENVTPGVFKTDVDGYTTFDIQASYEHPESDWNITAGIQNLFDADFPFFDSYRGVDSAHVDFRRRIFFFDVVKEFSW